MQGSGPCMNLIRTATIDLNNSIHSRPVFTLPEITIRDTASRQCIIVGRGQLWYVEQGVGLRVFSRVKIDARYKDGYSGPFNYGYRGMIRDQINKLPWGERYEIS